MVTSIQISEKLHVELAKRKMFDRETYEEVIWDLLEDVKEVNAETKREANEARESLRKGKGYKISMLKKEMGA